MSYETLVHELEQTQHDYELAVKEILQLKRELNATRAELNKARLVLAQSYEILDRVYNWEADYDVGELYGDDLRELAHIIKEYGI